MLEQLLHERFHEELLDFMIELLLDDYLFIQKKAFEYLKTVSTQKSSNFFKEPFLRLKS